MPTIVIEELSVSVGAGAASNANARNFEALGEHKPVVALDEQIARRAGALEGTHIACNPAPNLGPGDAIVAATGLTLNEPIVTNDTDFESVDGLRVKLY